MREHVQVLQVPQAYLDFLELLDPLVHNIMLAIYIYIYRSGSRIFKMCVGVM